MKYLTLFILLFFSCQKKQIHSPSTPVYPVKITSVKIKPIEVFLETIGHVVAINTVDIRSQVEGELTGVYFEEGQEVKKGDLLFTIDPRPFEAALKKSKANLQKTLAELLFAEQKMNRYEGLLKKEYFSEINYEQILTEVSTNQATAEQLKAQIDEDQINLNYCSIHSPIDAKTGILQIHQGNLVRKNEDLIVTLNQMEPIYVEFSISEKDFPKVLHAQNSSSPYIKVAYHDFSEKTFQGKLDFIDNRVDRETGMIKLRGIFPNHDRTLWPGQFVRSRLILKTVQNALIVPYSSIQLKENEAYVFVVKEGNFVRKKKVILGQRDQEKIQILEGLTPHDCVVIEGQLNLSDGASVRINKDEPI